VHETQILLVDDHQLVRAGLRSLLESIPTVKVVAEASDGRQALGMIAQYRPEIVLLDIAMPKLNGLETLARIRRQDARQDNSDQLTSRQREILQLIAEGKNTKEIAFDLSISAKTVEAHRLAIMERLRIRDLASLLRCAIRAGIVSIEA
jgi:DNA-binding NarL/FixJ family response regulator